MKPTVGRQVHYYGNLGVDQQGYAGPFAATVVKVNDDNTVNLCVLYASAPRAWLAPGVTAPNVVDVSRLGVVVESVCEDSPATTDRDRAPCWTWPPRA